MNYPAYYRELERRIKIRLKKLRIDPKVRAWAEEYLDENEFGLALHVIVEELATSKTPVRQEDVDELRSIADSMGVQEELDEFFAGLRLS